MTKKSRDTRHLKIIFFAAITLFALFLLAPMLLILSKSFIGKDGFTLSFYSQIMTSGKLGEAFFNSVSVSALSAIVTTILAFWLAYTINYTNVHPKIKGGIKTLTVVPMLLPTITYGFAIIYSFGKQGLLTMIFGRQLFDIYSVHGLMLGYVIYTLPVSFLLINNTMGYIDKKFMIVSRAMGDSAFKNFTTTIIRPLLGTFAASFIQSFTLCFTDYGIPTSVGGNMNLVANLLYTQMLGSIPNFNTGSAVAISMLIPSIVSIALLTYIGKYNIRYNKISQIELTKNKFRDISCTIFSCGTLVCILSIFAVIFVVPFVEQWPYKIIPTLDNVRKIFADQAIINVYKNSLFVAILSAIVGTLLVYATALVSARNNKIKIFGRIIDAIALVSNTIPGMVIGVAYLLTFSGTPLQNTFGLIIISNVIHFFSSPYLIMKNSLEKLNSSWETTARLMGDSWLKTVIRIITPNATSSLLEVFSYYFVNSMVTVSAVIFIAGARTMVITAKIKELQHFANFNEIFVLSILILTTNLVAKGLFKLLSNKKIKLKN
ncbi:MAG: ABC transporter permease subunit [Clostridia bacterium]